ncbi:MAG: hypothetical protein JNL01_12315 [Bdellovibrionales bacterium]|nr:hypothetical protein [Bdellovibrionales bacterium]
MTQTKSKWARTLTLSLVGLTILVVASGCGRRRRNHVDYPQTYKDPWYDVYGRVCHYGQPTSGCNFYKDGAKISMYEDPQYNGNPYFEYGLWDYYDSYGYRTSYTGWAWLSNTGILYDEYGYALNEEESESNSRDLLGNSAEKEEGKITAAGKDLASRFALAEETGLEIARTLNSMATLPKRLSRARTDQDLAAFSKKLYGVDLTDAVTAVTHAAEGDLTDLKILNHQVAQHWGTSAENSEQILKSFYKDFAQTQ